MKVIGLAVAASLTFSAAAFAQNAPDPNMARFQAFVTGKNYKDMLLQLTVMGQRAATPKCENPQPKSRAELSMFQPPEFIDGQEHPTKGLWRDRISIDACGKTAYQNILFQGQGTGAPRVALLLPGLTRVSPVAQNKILADVVANLAAKKCTDQTKIIPMDTTIGKETKKPKLDQRGVMVEGQWTENWTFTACGKPAKFEVTLTAAKDGGFSHKIK